MRALAVCVHSHGGATPPPLGTRVARPGPHPVLPTAFPSWHTRCLGPRPVDTLVGGTEVMAGLTGNGTTMAAPDYHGAVCEFKRRLIEATLQQMRGNRTHTARALGLQRTYLLRLIRELGVTAPPAPPPGRHCHP